MNVCVISFQKYFLFPSPDNQHPIAYGNICSKYNERYSRISMRFNFRTGLGIFVIKAEVHRSFVTGWLALPNGVLKEVLTPHITFVRLKGAAHEGNMGAMGVFFLSFVCIFRYLAYE